MTAPRRPRRQKKDDRLLSPDAVAAESACDLATAPFDRAARQMDATWGIDRLPELVTPALAARYGAALGALNEAIRRAAPAATAQNATNCQKGLAAMDAEARALGHAPMPPDLWECELDGIKYGVMMEGRDWAQFDRPDLTLVSLREALVAFAAYSRLGPVEKTKMLFPGSEITAIRERPKPPPTELEDALDDQIPF